MAALPIQIIDDQTKKFFRALDPDTDNHLLVGIPTSGSTNQQMLITRKNIDDNVLGALAATNNNGADIYVTVNEFNYNQGTQRTADTVSCFRAIFADDDNKTAADKYPLPPSMMVETSPGKYHVYWLLEKDRSIKVDQYERIQQGIVNRYGGDPNARDVARILRVPGFRNLKPDANGFVCRLLYINENRYTWEKILKAFPQDEVISSIGQGKGELLDIHAAVEVFITGTNYHGAATSIAGWLTNANFKDPATLTGFLQAMMIPMGKGDARYNQRFNESIPQVCQWIIDQRKKEDLPAELFEFKHKDRKGEKFTHLPQVGGGLHLVAEWVKTTMIYPNETIALIVAEHLISTFGGGHYHLLGNTTTRKRIMLAQQGTGKNTITSVMGKILSAMEALGPGGMPLVLTPEEYVGDDSFSFSNVHRNVEEHRVRSFVVNEAGQSGKSSSGDVDTNLAYHLKALSAKIYERMEPKKYSVMGKAGKENQLKTTYNGVYIFLHESTLDSYSEVLSNTNAYESGDIARSDVFFVDPTITTWKNNKPEGKVTPEVLGCLVRLANDFRRRPGMRGDENQADVWDEIDFEDIRDHMHRLHGEIVKARNEATRKDDHVALALLNRKYEKVLTTILVCALADASCADYIEGETGLYKPVAKKHHLEYAIKRAEALDKSLTYNISGGGALDKDQFKTAEVQFVSRFQNLIKNNRKRAEKLLGKTQTDGQYKWELNYTAFSQILKEGAFINLVRDVYRGDKDRARTAFIRHLMDLEIIERVTFIANDKAHEKRNKWIMNGKLFPFRK